jgi:hypothetical protein
VPLGNAVLIALTVLVGPVEAIAVAAAGIAVTAALRRRPRELAAAAGGVVAAAAARAAAEGALAGALAGDTRLLVEVVVAGAAYLGVDLVAGRRKFALVAPVYVTLLCAAALLAVAYEQSPALALVAAVPLLVTKYSFGRLTAARDTYAQTTLALSLLPEVAGLTPLGHGERTARYAAALADELGFDAAAVDRVTTAARLHHIGHISLHEPDERTGPVDTTELARVSAELLRETGFLDDVADLVEQAQLGGAAVTSLEAAIIRVCSTLDDLAEEGGRHHGGDPFAAMLVRHPGGLERTAAIALLQLHDQRPGIVDDARAASRVLATAAAAAGGVAPHGAADHAGSDHNGHDGR